MASLSPEWEGQELAKDSEKKVYPLWSKASSASEINNAEARNHVTEAQNTMRGALTEDDGPRSIYRTLKRPPKSSYRLKEGQSCFGAVYRPWV